MPFAMIGSAAGEHGHDGRNIAAPAAAISFTVMTVPSGPRRIGRVAPIAAQVAAAGANEKPTATPASSPSPCSEWNIFRDHINGEGFLSVL